MVGQSLQREAWLLGFWQNLFGHSQAAVPVTQSSYRVQGFRACSRDGGVLEGEEDLVQTHMTEFRQRPSDRAEEARQSLHGHG